MTVTAPSKPLYHSPWGLLDFQQKGVIRGVAQPENLFAWDTGIGKGHIAMASAAILFEDALIDLCLVVCEQNKIDEWKVDFERFTDLSVETYYGNPAKRATIRESRPQVLVSTYETIRNDAVHKVKEQNRRGREVERIRPHVFIDWVRGLRVLVVYDESTKLGDRGSGLYKAHDTLLTEIRKVAETRVMGLTATPIESSVEGYFNMVRLISPKTAGTVAAFVDDHVASKDFHGKPNRFKNLSANEPGRDPNVTPLAEKFAPIMSRKRKTDPDVIERFPKTHEEPPVWVELGKLHQEFYETVRDVYADADEETQRSLFVVLRQIAGHPLSLLESQGEVAKTIVDTVGREGLEALGAKKVPALIDRLRPITLGQGAQVVVFTFFRSMIPMIHEAIEAAGISVIDHHGKMTEMAKRKARQAFRGDQYQVLLSSDSGARGVNLPEASYCIEYEMALTRSNQIQRHNRIHRIDSMHPAVTFQSLVASYTVEEGIVNGVLRRNDWSDRLLGDEDAGEHFLTASQRKALFKIGKPKRR